MVDERKAAILRAVIEQYTDTAQPVGSSAAARAAGLKVSPATVRNDMAVLENEGYLTQPHTSAGRVPTEKGYRYFVDSLDLDDLRGRGASADKSVAAFFGELRGEIEQVMKETASLLSDLTDYAAVVVDDTIEAAVVRSVQLVPLAGRAVMSVAVLSNGQVLKQTFEFDAEIEVQTIEQASRLLAEAAVDRPAGESTRPRQSGDSVVDALVQQFYTDMVEGDAEGERVYVDGTSKVASAFQAVDSVSQVLTILEQQLVVVSLLADVVERGLSVAIGSETGVAPLSECSLVVSPYEIDGEHAGSIAVLGPTRMNYPQAMSAVAVVSRQLGRMLSEG
ncbi:MAG: heat-inducible transcriptional repressor HrcA [Acidimicrobiia bacterium]|nr:heat-inducible transcriptional repressor HrcA [Acidimicrobiia bacterium]